MANTNLRRPNLRNMCCTGSPCQMCMLELARLTAGPATMSIECTCTRSGRMYGYLCDSCADIDDAQPADACYCYINGFYRECRVCQLANGGIAIAESGYNGVIRSNYPETTERIFMCITGNCGNDYLCVSCQENMVYYAQGPASMSINCTCTSLDRIRGQMCADCRMRQIPPQHRYGECTCFYFGYYRQCESCSTVIRILRGPTHMSPLCTCTQLDRTMGFDCAACINEMEDLDTEYSDRSDDDDDIFDLLDIELELDIIHEDEPPLVTYQYMLPESTRCICLDDDIQDALVVRLSCGFVMHNECFARWIDQSLTCPHCRCRLDMAHAESSTGYKFEYVNSDSDGDLEYCDPVDQLSEIVTGDLKLHCYIITGTGSSLLLEGFILQVRDLHTDAILSSGCKSYDVAGTDIEISIIAGSPLECRQCSFVVEPVTRVVNSKQPIEQAIENDSVNWVDQSASAKILIAAFGTFGDIEPLRLISIELRKLGFEVVFVAPYGYSADIEFDIEETLKEYRKSPMALPSLNVVLNYQPFIDLYRMIKLTMIKENFDHVISTPGFPGIKALCELLTVPVTCYTAIPLGKGAFCNVEQKNSMLQWVARLFEGVILSLPNILPLMSGGSYRVFGPDDDLIRSFAPELLQEGDGGMILGEANTEQYDHDVFFTLGSTVTKEVESQYIKIFLTLRKLRFLFQTVNHTGVNGNITFIGSPCCHNSVMRDIPVVICHGGIGTLQTALYHGCRVLVHPFWIDQSFWPTVAKGKYNVRLIGKTEEQIRSSIDAYTSVTGHNRSNITMRHPSYFAKLIADRVVKKLDLAEGDYVYSSVFSPTDCAKKSLNLFGNLEEMIFGDARLRHTGFLHYENKMATYYDPMLVEGVSSIDVSVGPLLGVIRHMRVVNFDVRDIISDTRQIGAKSNCRTVTDNILASYGEFSLNEWHEDCKKQKSLHFSGQTVEIVASYRCGIMATIPSTSSSMFGDRIPVNNNAWKVRRSHHSTYKWLFSSKSKPRIIENTEIMKYILSLFQLHQMDNIQTRAGAKSTVFVGDKFVVKVTNELVSDKYISLRTFQIDHLLVAVYVFLYYDDDGGDVLECNIYCEAGQRITDLHRGNVRAIRGVGVLIDQPVVFDSGKPIGTTLDMVLEASFYRVECGEDRSLFHCVTRATGIDTYTASKQKFDQLIELNDVTDSYDCLGGQESDFHLRAISDTVQRSIVVHNRDKGYLFTIGSHLGDSVYIELYKNHYKLLQPR